MNITVQGIVESVLRVCKVVASGETPESQELTDALQDINMMLGLWSGRGLMIRGTVRTGFTLAAGTASYTIGSGQTWDSPKPYGITSAFVRDSNGNDRPVAVITKDVYNAKPDKDTSGDLPEELAYDPGIAQQATQVGTITVYPVPSEAGTLYLEMYLPLTQFVNFSDTVTFDDAYLEAIKYNAAKRIWGGYYKAEIPFPPVENELAKESMRVIENINSRTPIACVEIPSSRGGAYNIYSDGA